MSPLKFAIIGFITSVFIPTAFGDKRTTPEVVREFSSPCGEYHLLVTGSEGWKNPYASAELWHLPRAGEERRRVWRIDKLPHRLGPASALVSSCGVVILVDEWVRTPSPVSLTLIDNEGKTKAVFSFEDIARVSGESARAMVKAATIGAWQSKPPQFNDNAECVRFFTCETSFVLDLKTGEIAKRSKDPDCSR